ncbi:hypothetical protein RJT34_02481 [Clitoria ternatea]|uniref:Uncharacterized protein n=1 Tax=Clitoria ternatea TaxID=43366 RepID=A0AAN9Q1Q4_CLITE
MIRLSPEHEKKRNLHLCANEGVIIEGRKKEGFVYHYAKLEVAGYCHRCCCISTITEVDKDNDKDNDDFTLPNDS